MAQRNRRTAASSTDSTNGVTQAPKPLTPEQQAHKTKYYELGIRATLMGLAQNDGSIREIAELATMAADVINAEAPTEQ